MRKENRMKYWCRLAGLAAILVILAGCARVPEPTEEMPKEEPKTVGYRCITMEEAKALFETPGEYVIVDVRRADEFASGHIPGAINIPNESIAQTCPPELPDRDQLIYIYCRSGNRSKQASTKLAAMGYTNIVEFGGILDWTGATE